MKGTSNFMVAFLLQDNYCIDDQGIFYTQLANFYVNLYHFELFRVIFSKFMFLRVIKSH